MVEANDKIIENMMDKFYYPDNYYSSLDFIYKYVKEVLIKEISGHSRSYFLKIFTDLEDHRFAREKAISTNSLYNNVHPSLGISVNQDFSGAGDRTKMFQSNKFNYVLDEDSFPVIYYDNEITMQLSSNIFKYNIILNCRFSAAFEASNFAASILNSIPVNKYYYPQYSDLRYKLNKEFMMLLRASYNLEYEQDDKFLDYINRKTPFKIIREFEKASGNINYFMLLPIRPLIRVQSLNQTNDNSNGSRDSVVIVPIDIEIELPNTLYFSAPRMLLRKFNVKIFDSAFYISDSKDPILVNERKEQYSDPKTNLDKSGELKVVTMPKVDTSRIEKIHKKELKYDCTISIDNMTDMLIIEDPTIISFLNANNETILKIFDEEGLEIVPREIRKFKDSVEIYIDGFIKDTIVLVNIYG